VLGGLLLGRVFRRFFAARGAVDRLGLKGLRLPGDVAERGVLEDQVDGFSLDDKRQPVPENDIPDVLQCWENRSDAEFNARREARLKALRAEVEPLKQERLRLEKEINRLTFENVINPKGLGDPSGLDPLAAMQKELAELSEKIAPLQKEINQLTRQFWVTKEQVRANKYDLSASHYRVVEQDEEFYEEPQVTLERLLKLEEVMANEAKQIEEMLK